MRLHQIFEGTEHTLLGEDIDVAGLAYDSRHVRSGDLFFCINGFASNGNVYAAEAVHRGAAAIVSTEAHPELGVPQVIVQHDRRSMALASATFYNNPFDKLTMVGVTGTNGKTTTTYMIKRIAEQVGWKVGLIGTIRNMIGTETLCTDRTTPESPDLHRLLAEMSACGCDMVVMEVSSHSLALDRTYGITFDVGIFTNLTQDHLDFHGSIETYRSEKEKLFAQSRVCLVNSDDPHASHVLSRASGKPRTYGSRLTSNYQARSVELTPSASRYALLLDGSVTARISVPIPGMFSVYNSLAAVAASTELGIPVQASARALQDMPPVDGRFEVLGTRGRGFTLILDYAHTPDSLENTLTTVQEFASGRVLTVFGCGGNRDRTKRPLMGEIATRLSDFSYVTSDNPRFEDPVAIIQDIVRGIPASASYTCIKDRREAIRSAVSAACPGDVVVLAGKGHETYQEIEGVKYDFNEKVVVEQIFDELNW